MAQLTKSQTVLTFRYATGDGAYFEHQAEKGEDASNKEWNSFHFNKQDWTDMGSPQEVTLTIEPGNTLNE